MIVRQSMSSVAAVIRAVYELNNRPTWLKIPLQGILELMGTQPVSGPAPQIKSKPEEPKQR